jgi:hypothetical protein
MGMKLFTLILLSFSFVGFQNCMGSSSHGNDESVVGKSCEGSLRRLFAETYHPFLTTNCSNCHRDQSGPENGVGKWAHNDVNRSYLEFAGATRTRVRNRILDETHKKPHTGLHNQAFVDAHEAKWKYFEAEAEACRTGPQFSTIAKTLSGRPDAQGFYILEWDLFTEVRRQNLLQKIHLLVRIKIKPTTMGTPIYEFKDASARLRSGAAGNYTVSGIQVERNGELVQDFTTWLYLNNPAVNSQSFTALHTAGTGFAVVTATSLSDQFALRITSVRDSNGVEM